MKKLLRMLAIAAAIAGAVMVGYSLSVGFHRGFAVDLDGNWDPALIGIAGAVIAASGMLAYFYFTHAEAGAGRRRSFLVTAGKALRSMAVLALTLCEYGGVVAAVVGFIMFLTLERSGTSGLTALGVALCGAVAYRCATHLMPWAKGEDAAKKHEPSVSSSDEHDD